MAFKRGLPSPSSENWEWQIQAACRGMSSTLFFGSFGERPRARAIRVGQAKDVCADCPVIADCRRHALEAQEPYGVWGGQSEEERSVLPRRGHRRIAQLPS